MSTAAAPRDPRAHRRAIALMIVAATLWSIAGVVTRHLETAGRGVIYEHQPASLMAQRLVGELKAVLAELGKSGWRSLEGDAAIVLRRVEAAVRGAPKVLGSRDTAFLDLVARASRASVEPSAGTESGPRSPLVLA